MLLLSRGAQQNVPLIRGLHNNSIDLVPIRLSEKSINRLFYQLCIITIRKHSRKKCKHQITSEWESYYKCKRKKSVWQVVIVTNALQNCYLHPWWNLAILIILAIQRTPWLFLQICGFWDLSNSSPLCHFWAIGVFVDGLGGGFSTAKIKCQNITGCSEALEHPLTNLLR